MKRTYSDTFTKTLILLQMEKTYQSYASGSVYENGSYKRVESDILVTKTNSEIVISDVGLFSMVSGAAWRIIGMIISELKQYNALWECNTDLKSNNSTNRKAIGELLHLEVLFKTETTNIYLVNPKFIRRGSYHGVLATTANMLRSVSKVNSSHVVNKRPVREAQFLLDNAPAITGYGYTESD